MADRNGGIEDADSSLSISSMINKWSLGVPSDELSPEDVAWADSCLTKYLEISENDWCFWNSLRDALSETESVSSGLDSPTACREDYSRMVNTESSPSGREIDTLLIPDTSIDGVFPCIEGADKDIKIELDIEDSDELWSKINLENVFLPTYNENSRIVGASDAEDVGCEGLMMELSTVDIFKVWDLAVPTEEEFVEQLNEAFAISSLEPESSVPDDFGLWKNLEHIPIDDIISGMEDLSLNHIPLKEFRR